MHLDLAVDDDEELVRGRSLANDHVAFGDLDRPELRLQGLDLLRGEVVEDAVDEIAVERDGGGACGRGRAVVDELELASA